MRPLALDDDRVLRPVATSDLDELHALIVANREHLALWMPWAVKPKRADTVAFLSAAEKQAARDDGVNFAVIDAGRIVGTAGFHSVNRAHATTSIGYWLAADAQGRGTMTLAVAALLRQAFEAWDLHRVEIRVAVGNARSHAVTQRLGFVEEGILRGAERVGERWLDLVVYSVLVDEWQRPPPDDLACRLLTASPITDRHANGGAGTSGAQQRAAGDLAAFDRGARGGGVGEREAVDRGGT